jgi:hypothetical protein
VGRVDPELIAIKAPHKMGHPLLAHQMDEPQAHGRDRLAVDSYDFMGHRHLPVVTHLAGGIPVVAPFEYWDLAAALHGYLSIQHGHGEMSQHYLEMALCCIRELTRTFDGEMVVLGPPCPKDGNPAHALMLHDFHRAMVSVLNGYPQIRLCSLFFDQVDRALHRLPQAAPDPDLAADEAEGLLKRYLGMLETGKAKVVLNLHAFKALVDMDYRLAWQPEHGWTVQCPQLLAQCREANASNAHALSMGLTAALSAGVAEHDQEGVHLATVGLVNAFMGSARLAWCKPLLDQVCPHVPAPDLIRLRTDIARGHAGTLLKQLANVLTKEQDHFLSASLRPVLAQAHQLVADCRISERVAIVMQGPILHAEQFTLETLKLYARMYPQADLVLSTWEGEDVAAIEGAGLAGLIVVCSPKPACSGPSNINLQIVSAQQGVRVAIAQRQPQYILKTRTDIRFYNPNLFADMLALLESFPAKAGMGQKQRLLVFSDVVKYMQHAVSDKNIFGAAADVDQFWGAPLDMRPMPVIPRRLTMREWAEQDPAEVYLVRHYLRGLGYPLQDSLADHFAVLRDFFVVYDRAAADMYWHKYEHQLEYRLRTYSGNRVLDEFGFNEWLRLQSGRYAPCQSDEVIDANQVDVINGVLDTLVHT